MSNRVRQRLVGRLRRDRDERGASLPTLAVRHALEYPVLSDAGNAVAKRYGLVFTATEAVSDTMRKLGISLDEYNGDGAQTLPAATTFVVGATGRFRFAAASGDYRWRVGPEEVLAALCA
jgi:peroxiredoxin